MGRGRAKAKQAKIARQLKYQSPEMDLERLQRELRGENVEDDNNDEYSEWDEYGYAADDHNDWR
ncbi:DUF3073 domain-containing protein [Corynebacterium ulceribovis]|uniref:DUF3073 domain-containing protein n=1 Tax=Corynebacterium ulceribovis TaxID=487732 RepID=UPI00037AA8AB|nr:DUF3073 domain-containing protein [Corynebacterium ulceribovis]